MAGTVIPIEPKGVKGHGTLLARALNEVASVALGGDNTTRKCSQYRIITAAGLATTLDAG